jgi:hypothetical protein
MLVTIVLVGPLAIATPREVSGVGSHSASFITVSAPSAAFVRLSSAVRSRTSASCASGSGSASGKFRIQVETWFPWCCSCAPVRVETGVATRKSSLFTSTRRRNRYRRSAPETIASTRSFTVHSSTARSSSRSESGIVSQSSRRCGLSSPLIGVAEAGVM